MRQKKRFLKIGSVTTILLALLLMWPAVSGFAQTARQSALDPAGPIAQMQHDLFMWTVYVAIFIFIGVVGVMLYTIFRYRRKPGETMPKQIEGNATLEVVWTILPVIIVITIAVPTVQGLFYMSEPPTEDVLDVHVVGHQWWWEFQYPDYDIVTANELHIPTGKVVNLTLESSDVIHSFWVPNLAGKIDTNPGEINTLWLQADEAGVFHGQCAEFCGIAHANMRFRVIAQEPDEFEAWLAGWDEEALVVAADVTEDTPELVARGAKYFEERQCFACHAIEGTQFVGEVGPNLSRFGQRSTLAAGILPNTPENLSAWIQNPQDIKPGNQMPSLGVPDDEAEAIVAYLHSLQ